VPEPTSLLIEEGGRVRRVKLDGLPAIVGRDETCDIVLEDPSCSRRHLRLEAAALGCAAVDLDSSNGTLLDGAKVRRALLRRGAELRIGDAKITYLGGGADAEVKPPAAAASPAELARAAGRRPTRDDDGSGAPPEEGGPAEAPPPPPVSARTKAAANAVSLVIVVVLNLAAFFAFKTFFKSEPRQIVYETPAPPRPVIVDGKDTRAPDPEESARAAYRAAAAEADALAAEDLFDGAYRVLKAYLAAHGAAASADEAIRKIGELKSEQNRRLGNCLDNAESQAKLGATTTARKILELARKIAGETPDDRLASAEATILAAEAAAAAAASRPKSPPGK
jgi:hypothetical protein